jgi:hypothetical protein
VWRMERDLDTNPFVCPMMAILGSLWGFSRVFAGCFLGRCLLSRPQPPEWKCIP